MSWRPMPIRILVPSSAAPCGDYRCPGGLPALVEERASSGMRPVAPVASVSGSAAYTARTAVAQRGCRFRG